MHAPKTAEELSPALDWRDSWRRRRIRRAAAPCLLLLLIVASYWKLTLTSQFTWMDDPDLAFQVLPWFQMQAREWHAGHFPLWDPYHWGGQSLIGQAQPGAAYPLNWVLFLLPLRDGFIQLRWVNYYYVFIHYLGALFCYRLCRDVGCSRAASVIGGTLWALSGGFGTIGWPQMLNGALWAPLVLMFSLRALRQERPFRSSAWAGTFLGISLLSGHHQIPTFMALMVGGLYLYRLVRERDRLHIVAQLSLLALFCGLVGALQVLPGIEYGRESVRWVSSENPIEWSQKVPYIVHRNFSLRAFSVLGLILPDFDTGVRPYVGVAGLMLAMMAIVLAWTDRTVRILCVIGICSLVFALGGSGLFQGIAYAVIPGVDKARSPVFTVTIMQLAIAVLASVGIDVLRDPLTRLGQSYRRIVLSCTAAGGFLLLLVTGVALNDAAKGQSHERLAMAAFLALATAAAFQAWRSEWISTRSSLLALGGIMLIELSTVTTYLYRHREDGWSQLAKLDQHRDIAAFLKAQPGASRVEVDTNEVPYNFGDWYGIDTFEGYTASLPVALYRVQSSRETRDLFAVRYSVARAPAVAGQKEVFQGSSGLKVFENPGAKPRLWMETTAPCSTQNRVELIDRIPNRIRLRVTAPCEGTVITGEAWFPGWNATVDGRPASVERAHGLLQGVRVAAGEHQVELRYRPASVMLGAWLTTAGLIAAIALAFPYRRTLWSLSRMAVP